MRNHELQSTRTASQLNEMPQMKTKHERTKLWAAEDGAKQTADTSGWLPLIARAHESQTKEVIM